ncbi:MAG: hypothetical protein E4G98_00665 [Promethearchaeota archaeon]|nr:MAG: hypothetical protein E4G98_00665 [Candidatus Lokiarchaeota archaeon]
MDNILSSAQGLEILQALKSHEFIEINSNELDSLEQIGLVHHRPSKDSSSVLQANVEQLKTEYSELLQALDSVKHEYIKISGRIHKRSFVEEILYHFRTGKKTELTQELKMLNSQIQFKTDELSEVKNQLLDLISWRDGENSAFQVQNNGYQITPKGHTFIREIQQRPRFGDRNLQDLTEFLKEIDKNFQNQIDTIQQYIAHRKFTPVLLPYIAHLNQLDLIPIFDRFAAQYTTYSDIIIPEEKILQRMVLERYKFPRSLNLTSQINSLRNEIRDVFQIFGKISTELEIAIRIVAQILVYWAYSKSEDNSFRLIKYPIIIRYITNLKLIINNVQNSRNDNDDQSPFADVKFGGVNSSYKRMTTLLFAFADDPMKFNYFLPRVNHGIKGAKFFATALTLLPWPAEETWLLLKRAETHILMAQSVQYIPELLEYSIILNYNPFLLKYIGGLNEYDLEYWNCVIIPVLATIDVLSLNEEISDYVRDRPLAYVTNPSPYYHYYGYYPRRYWFFWGRHRHYTYYNHAIARTRPTYKTTRGRFVNKHRLYSGTRGGATSGGFGRGTRGSTRRTRYSSLHHHTIG